MRLDRTLLHGMVGLIAALLVLIATSSDAEARVRGKVVK